MAGRHRRLRHERGKLKVQAAAGGDPL